MSNDIQYFAKIKGTQDPPKPIVGLDVNETSTPVMGLLQFKPSSFEFSIEFRRTKKFKDLGATLLGYARISGIKRTRKRGIQRAKFMDHTSYQYSQWWHKSARKPKRWKCDGK